MPLLLDVVSACSYFVPLVASVFLIFWSFSFNTDPEAVLYQTGLTDDEVLYLASDC